MMRHDIYAWVSTLLVFTWVGNAKASDSEDGQGDVSHALFLYKAFRETRP